MMANNQQSGVIIADPTAVLEFIYYFDVGQLPKSPRGYNQDRSPPVLFDTQMNIYGKIPNGLNVKL